MSACSQRRETGTASWTRRYREIALRERKTLIASAAVIEVSRRHLDNHGTAIAQAANRAIG